MVGFIETVSDGRLQERLWRVIEGSGAFRRFRAVLGDDQRRRVLDWLAAEAIEVRAD